MRTILKIRFSDLNLGQIMPPTFYEFFAGGGMVRAALSPDWRCLFANDIDRKKADAYIANWGGNEFKPGDSQSGSKHLISQDMAWELEGY